MFWHTFVLLGIGRFMCRVCNFDMRIMAHSYEFVARDISSTLGSQDAANIEVERLDWYI